MEEKELDGRGYEITQLETNNTTTIDSIADEEVQTAINKLKTGNAPGQDGITLEMLTVRVKKQKKYICKDLLKRVI